MRLADVALAVVAVLTACSPAEDPTPTAVIPTRSASATTALTPSPTAPPTPTPSPTPQAAGTHLALGDSLAVGVGATRPDETGYVARIYRTLTDGASVPHATALRNLAVSGETSTSMIRTGQLAAALDAIANADPSVSVVTLDIGGTPAPPPRHRYVRGRAARR